MRRWLVWTAVSAYQPVLVMTRRLPALVLAALVLTWAAASAQEESPAVSLSDLKLLDDAPDLAAALADQWRGNDVPRGYELFESDTTYFGRLRDTGEPQAISISQAVGLALMNNTGLQIQRLVPLGARAEVRRSESMFDPSLISDTGLDRTVRPAGSILQGATVAQQNNATWNAGLRKLLASGGLLSLNFRNLRSNTNNQFIDLRPQYISEFGMSLNQPLLRDFGYRFTTLLVRFARNTQEQVTHQYEAAVASTIQQVETAYWNLVLATEAVEVQQQGMVLAKELERQNEGKYRVGSLPQTAVLEAQAEVARLQAELIRVENAETNARDSLRALINYRPPGSEELLMIEPADAPTVEERDFDLERSLATALEKRPELAAARLDVRGRGMLLKVAENQLLPRLNAVGSLGTNGLTGSADARCLDFGVPPSQCDPNRLVINPFTGSYAAGLNRAVDGRYYSYSAGLTIEIPLGNAQAEADYARSRIDLESAQRQLQQRQEQVTLEVKRAVTTLLSDLQSIDATRVARELSEENLRNQQARFDVGLATTKDLLDFQDQLTQARFREVNARTRYRNNLAELHRAEGTLLQKRNIVIDRGQPEESPWWAYF